MVKKVKSKSESDDPSPLMTELDDILAQELEGFADSDCTSEGNRKPDDLPLQIYTIGTPDKKCPKCSTLMERRVRTSGATKVGQKHYFIAWDFCPKCKHLQHYEKYKVYKEEDYQQAFESYSQGRLNKRILLHRGKI